ncbi:muconate/chloromuconate family cycloisomerase [Hirschia litorea]|uniref:Muconate/chloromuconate family cycloisomerase n=1 Tax=Hirschia litorea TaxID=1199156 RepID=A0ABW2IK65_9PROT
MTKYPTSKTRIVGMEVTILRIPTIRAHTLSMATMKDQRCVVIQIETEDGLVGLGEAATIGGLAYSDESPEGIKLTLEKYFKPIILGMDSARPGEVMYRIRSCVVGNFFAKMAVDTALLDITGKRSGLPVSELVGGRITNRLEVAWTLASGDTLQDISEGRRVLDDRRHRHFKLKIGKRSWQEDVEHAGRIVDAFKGEATIRVDLNQAWDLATAKRAVPALVEAGVTLVEQPLSVNDLEGSRILRETTHASIMADESLRGGSIAAKRITDAKAADVFALKIAQAGGLFACRSVAELGLANGMALYGGTMLEGPIATIASAHLFSTLPEFAWGTELFGPLLLAENPILQSLNYHEFGLEISEKPGLGVEINPDALQEFSEYD